LGRSLGLNNIPAKVCSYSCLYCQLGRTEKFQAERAAFYEPEAFVQEVEQQVARVRGIGEGIDYLTFVADGEPTLDLNLGREIDLLRSLGSRIAVISNASLISRSDVRDELSRADWVSLKVDCTREEVWRRINRPQRSLQLDAILDGICAFARAYRGTLVTETMLVGGVNDDSDHLRETARFVTRLAPARVYLSVPIRPPAEKWVRSPGERQVNRAYQIFKEYGGSVECLMGYEGDDFTAAGTPEEDILSITAVHPMRREALDEFLLRSGAEWSTVERLLAQGHLVELTYQDKKFYLRRLPGTQGR
jgi:wyosine [tRNA(Phe)-imidazoG37] synthetase (radical SAM superfamily)